MTIPKRIFDLIVASLLLVALSPVILLAAVTILLVDGRPVLYPSERMKAPGLAFTLWKFRTMRVSDENSGVTGANKSRRITTTGRWMRSSRLDEIPQLFNVLRGDISLVGPRPPLRLYVEAAPGFYDLVLKARPGITGLATLFYHRHEARILARCKTARETHETYLRRCVPMKARLDLIYLRRRSICLDIWVLWQTLRSVTGLR